MRGERGTRTWWLGVGAATAFAVVAGAWGIARQPLEPYYAASVRSMAGSGHAFWFGAFDPAATLTMDKLPGAFWVQALVVAVAGPSTTAMVLPQVVAMALAVVVLAVAVRALTGSPAAGVVAAMVLAVSPAAVGVARGNVADPLMILLLVTAAWAVARALHTGRPTPWLAVAGLAVGLAFQAKMLAAWLVLPALAVAFLVAAPVPLGRRIAATAVGGVVTAVVSFAWIAAVSLVPAGQRPWVDGSTDDSELAQVFVYNGLGRLGAQNPLQELAGQGLALTAPGTGAEGPSIARLLVGDLGRSTGWLAPAALLALVVGLWAVRRSPRTDPRRAAYLLFGLWLLVYGVAFSAGAVVNVYYVATLAPAIAGLLGTAFAHLLEVRGGAGARLAAGAAVVVTIAYSAVLVLRSEHPVVTPVVVAVLLGVGAVGLVATARRGALVTALVAVLVLPVAATGWLLALGGGAFDTPYESVREIRAVRVLLVAAPRLAAGTLPGLERSRAGAPDLMAVQSAAVASVFAAPTGDEVLPIGGFTGIGPTPTLDQLRADIAAGRFHVVLSFPSTDPRFVWVAEHCRAQRSLDPTFQVHVCVPADATRP
ncbi:glycosyltransferase family 39 protein [Actinomycetospora corticicola]|uniref:4-amino-4-deoxy-L-arabinose transferase-like glycosyltransferase n=1 Tax=Actinomycetospora corticicola TaxID=663602 RepID=A0A7Y9E149_9PSEU|nr:glycosyltransferase family 39 protein [Actinomycetospora corticicola]NYD39132.1 4-amino-4-deoxy-L-arabinose transferase-like glycosyltransferase [Actinomycetospora corticicola]